MENIYNTLYFYKKEKVKIKFRLDRKQIIEHRGFVLKLSLGRWYSRDKNPYVIIQDEDKPKVKIYLEDIDPLTIVPNEIKFQPEIIQYGRVPIPPKMRFNVLERDGHTCFYCGKQPEEVILELDHVKPIAAGGLTEEDNLVTSCRDCNRGKGAR